MPAGRAGVISKPSAAAAGGGASAIPHTDTFNRADSTTGLGTSSGGLPWVDGAGTGVIGISLNNAYHAVAGVKFVCLDVNDSDATILFTYSAFSAGSGYSLAPVFRYKDANNYYYCELYNNSPAQFLYVYRVINGVGNYVSSLNLGGTTSGSIKIECQGDTVRIYNLNGTLNSTIQDSLIGSLGKKVGLRSPGSLSAARLDTLDVTAPPAATAPGAMSAPTAQRGSAANSVELRFTAPFNNGSAITGYTVTPFIGATAQAAVAVAAGVTSAIITGLTAGTAYTFKIKATNSVGTGVDSLASIAVTPASALTLFAPSSPYGAVHSQSTVYATARTGASLSAASTGDTCGQIYNAGSTTYYGGSIAPTLGLDEIFIQWDTSGIVGTISAAFIELYMSFDQSSQDFIVEARLHDWGTTLESTDWVPGESLASKTLLATLDTLNIGAVGYKQMVNVALPANINRAGFTRIVLASSRLRSGLAPTSTTPQEQILIGIPNDFQVIPRLVVTAS